MSISGIKLFPHQIEAAEAIVRGLDIPPGKTIPRQGLRVTAVSACGTGKTFIAAAAARRLAPHGRVLVLVPTLELLAQTAREWRVAGHRGPAVAVCSLEDDPAMYALEVRSTTNPIQLALWHSRGPVTIYATYASLPVLVEAFVGSYGQKLGPLDLAVVDEAHRTSGSAGKAWAVVHDNEQIPALRRLYMTATPRIWKERPPRSSEREGAYDPLPEELACSMDDPKIFGPVVFDLPLSSAVSRGLLARYQIVVLELRDPVVTPQRLAGEQGREEVVRGQRMAALQAALLAVMVEHRLQTTITFHHRTVEAEAFSRGLGRVAKRLHAADPDRYPERVWAGWLCGDHAPEERREVLGGFARVEGPAVLSNCRVLNEGIDIRAVDSVALLDPKGSPVDIVQAIGRALRQKPGQGKVATLVVPVFLGPDEGGEGPEDILTSASWKPLVTVLEGLRAHDEQTIEMLAVPQELQKRMVDPSPRVGEAEDEDAEDDPRFLLRFARRRDPVAIAHFVRYRVIEPERADWRRGLEAARRYREREGDLEVPYEHREGAFPLGRWLSDQRRVYRSGRGLPTARAEALEGLGVVWDPADVAFAENLAAARAYFAEAGTLAAPRGAMMLDRPVGQWLTNIRRPGGLGKDTERAERRARQLAAIDPDWNPRLLGWTVDWQRHYAGLNTLLDAGGTLDVILPGVTYHGDDIGTWLRKQRTQWDQLNSEQQRRLAALGVTPAPRPKKAAAQDLPRPAGRPLEGPAQGAGARARSGRTTGAVKGSEAFQRGLAALRQYAEREGHVRVPRQWIEHLPTAAAAVGGREVAGEPDLQDGQGTPVRLGVWLSNTRQRRHRLTDEQRGALTNLDINWATN